MTTLATSDLDWADIQSILGDTGDASLQELCMHANVDPLGLSLTYCPGDGPTARYNNLRTAPYNMGYFRGYMDPNSYIFCVDMGDIVVYRGKSGDTLHSSKSWNFGFEYYTGAAYSTMVFNQTTRLCNTLDFEDYAIDFGAVNATITGPHGPGSPNWYRRYEDETWPLTVTAGSYYWMLSVGSSVGFYSDDFGEAPIYYVQMTLADYLLSEPDEFLNFSSGGGSSHFHVWTGLYSNSVAISGGVYLTGATNGTGNRQQNFTIPNNTTGFPITHHILTTAAGMTSSHVYIYQLA